MSRHIYDHKAYLMKRSDTQRISISPYTPIFAGSAVESALESVDSSPELADYNTSVMIVGRQPISNMFIFSVAIELADRIYAVSQLHIGQVGTNLKT